MRNLFLLFALVFFAVCSCTSNETAEQKDPEVVVAEATDTVADEPLFDKGEIAKQALALCKYIPDHGIREGAEDYMTAEYYRAYTEAINAPRTTFDIGDDAFLYTFINDGEDEPAFSVKDPETDVVLIDDTHATVRISIKDMYTNEPYMGSEFSLLTIENVDGKWVIADFDDTKRDCVNYSKFVREEFKSGSAEKNLRMEGADDEDIENFYKEVEEFYRIYGKD